MICSINTNFTLVNEDIILRLIESKVDHITVSIWAGNAKTYAATHPNKNEEAFYKIRNMLKMLNSLKKGRAPYIKVYNVISSINFSELEEMIELAKDTGCDAVEFTVIDTIPLATDSLVLTQEERKIVLEQCQRIKKNVNEVAVLNLEHFMRRISDSGADNAQYDSEFINTVPCYIGWLFSRIMPDGDVNSCLKSHRIPVGNLYEKSFKEIWNSPGQVEFRLKAARYDKDDPFFKMIGNDPDCKVGCFKSCDDLGRNIRMRDRINQLSPLEKTILGALSRICKPG
jgi:MoaA/NifB/PqqE/SkfB family radical SAM enzyme